jgi:hypothetical protein
LRGDYNVVCYTSEWYFYAAYASGFIAFYVIGFPLLILKKLWGYKHRIQNVKIAPPGLLLGFLLDDYKLMAPCYMWEAEEMLRKLLLSVMGAFFSKKSAVVIGSALVVSLFFQILHSSYYPYKSLTCNRLQQIQLTVLNLLYLSGLLLKTAGVSDEDSDNVGGLLVTLLVVAMVSAAAGGILTVLDLFSAVSRTRVLAKILRVLPQEDPPDDTLDFYSIQIPVQEGNMGDAFTPKSPNELAGIPRQEKLRVVKMMSDENEARLDRFFDRARVDTQLALAFVKSTTQVDSVGRVCAKYSRKTVESICAKARRPAILSKNPHFGIEHVRDTFRFKAVVFSFRDAIKFILAMHGDPNLCPNGLCAENVAKLDIQKLKTPKEWGWRFMAFDFITPNRQIVECYIVFSEMEHAKKNDMPDAVRCKDISNHEIFEKWRIQDVMNLSEADEEEYKLDLAESNRRYRSSFEAVLSHTPHYEIMEFWLLFGHKLHHDNRSARTLSVEQKFWGMEGATRLHQHNSRGRSSTASEDAGRETFSASWGALVGAVRTTFSLKNDNGNAGNNPSISQGASYAGENPAFDLPDGVESFNQNPMISEGWRRDTHDRQVDLDGLADTVVVEGSRDEQNAEDAVL